MNDKEMKIVLAKMGFKPKIKLINIKEHKRSKVMYNYKEKTIKYIYE